MKIAVSFIKSNISPKETIDLINQTSADYLHVDVMDGIFVENKNYEFEDIKQLVKDNHKPLDIHLMVKEPLEVIKDYVRLNPSNITFHLEATSNPLEIINYIHDHHIKCGMAINPETSLDLLLPYLNLIDIVLIMSVHPGKGGQSFIPDVCNKIEYLNLIKKNFTIEVDGGINGETISKVKNVDIAVSGSYICGSDDYEERINKLKNLSN